MQSTIYDTPVALIIFNRPDLTGKNWSALSRLKPREVFVIADGPREGHPTDVENCRRARKIIDSVSWECEVKKNYSEKNMGCKNRIASGLNWLFENVERAIILEDDCLPDPSFFPYCQELLDYYHFDERIMVISGSNFQFGKEIGSASYYFSRFNHCWGWATWKRAWEKYDVAMKLWPEIRQSNTLQDVLSSRYEVLYWTKIFDRAYSGQIDTWDYAWTFTCWINNGLTILPNSNLVSNIGFGDGATHTMLDSPVAHLPVHEMKFPLIHPHYILANRLADQRTEKLMFSMTRTKRAYLKIKGKVQRLFLDYTAR